MGQKNLKGFVTISNAHNRMRLRQRQMLAIEVGKEWLFELSFLTDIFSGEPHFLKVPYLHTVSSNDPLTYLAQLSLQLFCLIGTKLVIKISSKNTLFLILFLVLYFTTAFVVSLLPVSLFLIHYSTFSGSTGKKDFTECIFDQHYKELMRLKLISTIFILLFPFCAFAHGQEALIPVFIQLIFIISLIAFLVLSKLPVAKKLLLGSIYCLTLALIVFLTWDVPYQRNRTILDLTIALGSAVISMISYLIIRYPNQI